jgi:hypothetical protein
MAVKTELKDSGGNCLGMKLLSVFPKRDEVDAARTWKYVASLHLNIYAEADEGKIWYLR